MGEGREERRELDGHRNAQASLHLAHDVDRLALDLGGARRHVAGGVIEVQLEAVGARLARAAARIRASRRGVMPLSDAITGMSTASLITPQVLEVLVGPERQERIGAKAGRLGERLVEASTLTKALAICSPVISSSKSERSTSIAAPASSSALTVSRSSPAVTAPDDQRMRQPHPEIGRAEIHRLLGRLRRRRLSVASVAITGTVMPASCW